jgi:membrane fusion protein (multidrug efflux system)
MSSQNPVPAESASAQSTPSQGAPAQSPPNPNAATTPPAKNSRGMLLRVLVIVVVLGIIGWALWYFLEGRWYEGTDDAYVNGNVVQITPQIAGTVVSIGADDGDRVRSGEVLVQFDPSDADVALAEAKANLANTVRKVRGLYSSVNGAQADVAARKVAVDKARADYNRRRDLAKSGAISAEELSHASDALTTAESGLITSQQQFETSKVLVDDSQLVAGDGDSYRYLAESIRRHPDQETLRAMMVTAGFEECAYYNLMGGIVAVHRGYRI